MARSVATRYHIPDAGSYGGQLIGTGSLGSLGRWRIAGEPGAVTAGDREILRELGARKAEIAALPVHAERAERWRRMNDLDPVKPMVWITEEPWHELDGEGELTPRAESEFARDLEQELRRTLYEWEHTPCDLIVEPVMFAPIAFHDSGMGITGDSDLAITDSDNVIVSRHFHPTIRGEEDLHLIQRPELRLDEERTAATHHAMAEIFDGVIPVARRGLPGLSFSPWDELVRWTGIQEVLLDLALRPDYVHALMEKLMDAYLHRLDQAETLGLLASNNTNIRVGSGAYGYTSELPATDTASSGQPTRDLWGFATAQIFGSVSPPMHDEFALQYELRWLKRFGLNYYGCCEPLHDKIEILRQVPNLRKISMSAWADLEAATAKMGDRYVYSLKVNPSWMAGDEWNPEAFRAELRANLTVLKGCAVEVDLKDISTVNYDPPRLWEWARIATEVAEEFTN